MILNSFFGSFDGEYLILRVNINGSILVLIVVQDFGVFGFGIWSGSI